MCQTLHAVWTAFFSAWSTELNAQCGGEIMGMADERHRLTEELTARRHEAMQMRDGIQRLMRDQVDRMLQVGCHPQAETARTVSRHRHSF
jgi:hypothetical protein